MAKKSLDNLDVFAAINDGDTIFGKSASAGKYGHFPIALLLGNGYACRRWRLDRSTPVGEAVGNIDYLRNLPSLIGLGCYLVDDAHNRRKLDPTNHYKLATGETALLDGSMGQYMWGWRTPFYIAIWVEGNYLYKAASLKPIPGRENYRIPIASKGAGNAGIMDRTNDKLCSVINTDAQFRGGNGSVLSTGTASAENLSMLGYAATNMGTSTFQEKGANRGSGWGAGWYWIETVTLILFDIIMGTRHCQENYNGTKDANGLFQGGLGLGVTNFSGWSSYNDNYPVVPYSAGISMADGVGVSNFAVKDSSGTTVFTAHIPVFFGLKNPYGHLNIGKNLIVAKKATDGSYNFYVAKSSKEVWNYSSTSQMLFVGSLPAPAEANWSYIKRLNFTGLAGVPSECEGASSSTYYTDGCYRDIATSGYRSPWGCGQSLNGANAGLACCDLGSTPVKTSKSLSSPLCETPDDFDPVPIIVSA